MFHSRVIIILLGGIYYLLLRASYELVESHLFQSIGLVYRPPHLSFEWLSFVLAVSPTCWMPIRLQYASQVCYWILYLTIVVPMMFLPFHVLPAAPLKVVILPATILLLFAALHFCYRFPAPRFAMHGDEQIVAWSLAAAVALLTVLAFITSGGFKLNLALDDVYDRRLAARDIVVSGSFVAYAISTLSYSAAPITLLLGFIRRNGFLMVVAMVGFAATYTLRATKTDLFMPSYLIALCVLARSGRKHFGMLILAGAILTVATSLLQFLSFERYDISDYLIRRQLFVPSLLTSWYWEYFSSHPLIYFTDRSYGHIFGECHYDLPMARLIGYEYLNQPELNANTCFWASAYANVGYVGMAVATGALGVVFRIFDGFGERSEFGVVAPIAGLLGFQLANGALESCLVTGGVLVSFGVFYFLPARRPTLGRPALAPRQFATRLP